MSIFKKKQEDVDLELSSYINAFELKRNLWDSTAEEKVYRILRYYIHESYVVVPHVPFLEVFPIGGSIDHQTKELLRKKVATYHFDFVVFDAEFHPVLIIELNGGMHQQKEYKKKIDSFKKQVTDSICSGGKEKIKLIFIDELCKPRTDDELIEIIRNNLKVELGDRVKYPTYCHYCGYMMDYKKGPHGWYYECCQRDCTAPTNRNNRRIIGEKNVDKLPPAILNVDVRDELTAEKLKELVEKPINSGR